MYQIIKDSTKGTIEIKDSWSISATGSLAPPQFTSPDDEIGDCATKARYGRPMAGHPPLSCQHMVPAPTLYHRNT